MWLQAYLRPFLVCGRGGPSLELSQGPLYSRWYRDRVKKALLWLIMKALLLYLDQCCCFSSCVPFKAGLWCIQGFYGEVYEGLLNSDQVIQVAVKRLRPEMYNKYKQEFDNEFRTMIRVQHPNCVRIIGQCINKDSSMYSCFTLFIQWYSALQCTNTHLQTTQCYWWWSLWKKAACWPSLDIMPGSCETWGPSCYDLTLKYARWVKCQLDAVIIILAIRQYCLFKREISWKHFFWRSLV